MDSAPQDVFSLVQQALDHALRPLERRLASLEGHNTSMPVGNLESGQEHDSRIVDGTCTQETDPLLILVASQSADSSLARSTVCSSQPAQASRASVEHTRGGSVDGDLTNFPTLQPLAARSTSRGPPRLRPLPSDPSGPEDPGDLAQLSHLPLFPTLAGVEADDLDSGSTHSLVSDGVGPNTDWPAEDGDEEEKSFTRHVYPETAKFLESCLRSELRRKSRQAISRRYPRPDTPAALVPALDAQVTRMEYGADKKPPRSEARPDRPQYLTQAKLLNVVGPLCDVLEHTQNPCLREEGQQIREAATAALRLLGDAYQALTIKRCSIYLSRIHPKLSSLATAGFANPGQSLFGPALNEQITKQAETDKAWADVLRKLPPSHSHVAGKDRRSSSFGQDQGDGNAKRSKPSEASREPFFQAMPLTVHITPRSRSGSPGRNNSPATSTALRSQTMPETFPAGGVLAGAPTRPAISMHPATRVGLRLEGERLGGPGTSERPNRWSDQTLASADGRPRGHAIWPNFCENQA